MMKQLLRKIFLFLLLLTACSSDPFPDCCISQGEQRDAPFTTTYLSQFKTGASDIVSPNPDALLRIITQADIMTLKNAASTSQLTKNGLISGVIQGPQGPASEAALQVTDADGNVIGLIGGPNRNLYYNSLGRVPDFIIDQGTSSEGTFTLFNAPPGEVFFQVIRGGRGNGRIPSFPSAVSIGRIDVLPVFPERIGILGSITEPVKGINVEGAAASFFGREKVEQSAAAGIVLIPADQGLPTNGEYLVRLSAPGFRETSHGFTTGMDAVLGRQQAFDPLTDDGMLLYSEETLRALAAAAGVALLPTTEVIVGRISPGQAGVTITPAGIDAVFLGRVFYFNESGQIDPALTTTTNQSGFILFPDCAANRESPLFLNATGVAINPQDQSRAFSAGRAVVYCRPGAFVQGIALGPLTAGAASFTVPVNGEVRAESVGSLVSDAGVEVVGSDATLYRSNSQGQFTIPLNPSDAPNAVSPFLANSPYTVRVSKAGFLPTYQSFTTGPAGGKRDLQIFTAPRGAALCPPAGRGMIYGAFFDLGLVDPAKQGRATAGISLAAYTENGTAVGKTLYLDAQGNPTGQAATSDNGRFVVCDLPYPTNGPTLFQLRVTSPEDSGAFLVLSYPDGATLVSERVNKALPREIPFKGTVQSLAGPEQGAPIAVGDARISILGKGQSLAADTSGVLNLSLESNSRFIVRADREGYLPSYNYQIETHARNGAGVQAPIWMLAQGELEQLARQAGLPLPLQGGVVAGKVIVPGFETNGSPLPPLDAPAQFLRVGFFDDNARPDLLAVSSQGKVTLMDRTGAAPPVQLTAGSQAIAPVTAVESGDYNGDGQIDLLILNNKKLFLFPGNRSGEFASGTEIPLPVADRASAFTVADLNGDAFPDLVVGLEGDLSLVRLLNRGDGSFDLFKTASGISDPTGGCGFNPTSVAVRQSGVFDVVLADPVKGLCDLTFNADGAALQPQFFQLPPSLSGSAIKEVKAAFLNSDGISDLIVLHSNGGAFLLGPAPNQPVGEIAPAFTLPSGFNPSTLTPADINRDGRIDLIVAGSGGAYYLSGNGDGTFGAPALLSASSSARLAVGDLDEDGTADLVLAGSNDGALRLLRGSDQPKAGIRIGARNAAGEPAGIAAYPDPDGQIRGAAATTDGGRFIFFNVPPGFTHLSAAEGGSGNAMVNSNAGGLSYTQMKVNPVPPTSVLLDGQVINPTAGDFAGIDVRGIHIIPVGTATEAISGEGGKYQLRLGANSEHLIKLDP